MDEVDTRIKEYYDHASDEGKKNLLRVIALLNNGGEKYEKFVKWLYGDHPCRVTDAVVTAFLDSLEEVRA